MKPRKRWPDSLVDAISASIAARRKELGLTVYAVSQESGVSQQAISYYERRERRPTLECLAKVARALDWELSDLILDAEERLRRRR